MTFKRDDVKPCSLCGRGIAHNNPIGMFWRLKVERLMLDPRAIQREAGMEKMMGGGVGGAVLTRVMGTNPELAQTLDGPHEVLVCEPCVMEHMMELFQITEKIEMARGG